MSCAHAFNILNKENVIGTLAIVMLVLAAVFSPSNLYVYLQALVVENKYYAHLFHIRSYFYEP